MFRVYLLTNLIFDFPCAANYAGKIGTEYFNCQKFTLVTHLLARWLIHLVNRWQMTPAARCQSYRSPSVWTRLRYWPMLTLFHNTPVYLLLKPLHRCWPASTPASPRTAPSTPTGWSERCGSNRQTFTTVFWDLWSGPACWSRRSRWPYSAHCPRYTPSTSCSRRISPTSSVSTPSIAATFSKLLHPIQRRSAVLRRVRWSKEVSWRPFSHLAIVLAEVCAPVSSRNAWSRRPWNRWTSGRTTSDWGFWTLPSQVSPVAVRARIGSPRLIQVTQASLVSRWTAGESTPRREWVTL